MKLAAYLAKKKMSQTDFAVAAKISAPMVCRYISGERLPSSKTMKLILAATNGVVKPNDFYST